MKRELSIFIDESGDFGEYAFHAPYYIVSFVLHEQSNQIQSYIEELDHQVQLLGFQKHAIHTGPLIRRESIYIDAELSLRQKLFRALFHFARKVPIRYAFISVKKAECKDKVDLSTKISRGVAEIIRNNYKYFQGFDTVIVYYDNGQIELTRILTAIFNALLSNVDFRKVAPTDYKLFQTADLICTLELLNLKATHKDFTKSECAFFGGVRDFKKNYYKTLKKKSL